jgi:3-dehydroshikimate dehydratase
VIRPGLCSVTLRGLPPDAVIGVAAEAGLEAIEWGADVHVPAGDVPRALAVREATERAGLAVASYGSYLLRRGPDDFAPVLASAVALGAPRIRVWAGWLGSASASPEHRAAVVAAVNAAAEHGVELAFEFHGGTLTDTVESCLELLGQARARTYWQPPVGMPDDEALAGLERVIAHVPTVHVFSWWPERERLPLEARADLWRRVFARLAVEQRPFDALLEFVAGDSPDGVLRDAATLRGWLG